MVVKRKRFGTLPLDDLPHDQWEGYPSGAWAAMPTIALYWCDGQPEPGGSGPFDASGIGPTEFDFVGYFGFLAKTRIRGVSENETSVDEAALLLGCTG